MINIDTVVLGSLLAVAAFLLKIWLEMKVGIRDSILSETGQDTRITNCNHRIEILENKLEAELDRAELITNGLLERITHNRQVLEDRLSQTENYLKENSNFRVRSQREQT